MKFKLEDREKIITHWMLQSFETAKKICETPAWIKRQELTARVTVNGVELDFDIVEKYFIDIYRSMEAELLEEYKDMEGLVQKRLEQRLKTEAKPLLDKMAELQNVLDSAGDMLKPYWEK